MTSFFFLKRSTVKTVVSFCEFLDVSASGAKQDPVVLSRDIFFRILCFSSSLKYPGKYQVMHITWVVLQMLKLPPNGRCELSFFTWIFKMLYRNPCRSSRLFKAGALQGPEEKLSLVLIRMFWFVWPHSTLSTGVTQVMNVLTGAYIKWGLPWWRRQKRILLQCRRAGFDPSLGKIS